MDDDLDQMVRNSPPFAGKSVLASVPEVGRMLCLALLARLPELGRLNRAEVAKLVGVAPLSHDSGKLLLILNAVEDQNASPNGFAHPASPPAR